MQAPPRRKRPRVCIVRQTDLYEPPVQREAEALAGAGFDVEVLCMRHPERPRRARVNGVRITSLPASLHRSSRVRYALGYAWFFLLVACTLAARHLRRPYAAVQVKTMPDFLVFAAVVPKLLGARVFAYMNEPTPELAETLFGPGPLNRVLELVEQRALAFADHAFTVTEELKQRYVDRGADPERITVVLNGADPKVRFGAWSPAPSAACTTTPGGGPPWRATGAWRRRATAGTCSGRPTSARTGSSCRDADARPGDAGPVRRPPGAARAAQGAGARRHRRPHRQRGVHQRRRGRRLRGRLRAVLRDRPLRRRRERARRAAPGAARGRPAAGRRGARSREHVRRDARSGVAGRRRARAGRRDRGRLQPRRRRGRGGGRPGDPLPAAGAPVRPDGGHGPPDRARRAPGPRDPRGRLPGPRRGARRRARRARRAGGGVQLLPGQEPRRDGRRRRAGDRRPT